MLFFNLPEDRLVGLSKIISTMSPNTDTRHRILEAAINIFSTKGYHNARVDEIVDVAGASKGGVYFHFPSKQDIFLSLIDEFANQLEQDISEAIEQETSGVRRVDAALIACVETFSKHRRLAKIFLIQAVGLGAAFEEKQWEIHDRFVAIVKQHLDEAVRDGDIPAQDTEIAAYAWMGALNEVVIRWIHTGEPDLEQALPDLRVFLLRSIGVPDGRIEESAAQLPPG
jgi:AcrR family transcriptional regulator